MDLEKLSLLLGNKKTKNFFIYGLGQAINVVSPLLVIPYVIAVCGEDGFGKVGLGFSLSLFLILIVDYAFDVKGTKEASEKRDNRLQLEKLYIRTIFIKCLLLLPVVLLFLLLIFFVPLFSEEKLLFTLSLSIVVAQAFTPIWFFQGTEQYTAASILNICSKGLYLILVYTFITSKTDYVYVNLFLGGSAFLFNIAGMVYIIGKYSFRIMLPGFKDVTAILRGDFSFCLSQLFLSARQLLPVGLISYFLGYEFTGQYKILEQVITSSRTFIQVFQRYFYPIVCYKMAENVKEGTLFWKKYSSYNFLLVVVVMIAIAFMWKDVLYFFNASPKSVGELQFVFLLSLFVPVLMSVSLPLEQLMFITGKERSYTKIVFTVTTINIALVLSVLNIFGIMGVIITMIATEVLFISLYFKNSYLHLSHN